MLATSVSACATERPAQDCETLWRGQRWHQAEDPIWVSPSVPDQGVVPTLKMWALTDPSGSRFVPANIEESNCLLDRILGWNDPRIHRRRWCGVSRTRQGSGYRQGRRLAAQRGGEARGRRSGCREGRKLTGRHAELDTQSTCNHNTKFDRSSEPIRAIFALCLWSAPVQQLYGDVVRIAFLRRSPGRPTISHGRVLGATARARSKYAPPNSLQAQGCPAAIDYQWPHIDRPLPSQTDLPDDAALHFGVCPSSKTIWFFPVNQRWHPLNDTLESEFCSEWGDDRQFAEVCQAFG